MAFRLGRGGKRAQDAPLYEEEQVIWGVPRRAGLDEQDDPKAHGGLTQHAFELGNDERAICGFEPPKRASGPTAKPRAQLAVPNPRLNPRCPKCVKLIAVPVVVVEAAEEAAEDLAVEDEAVATDEAMTADEAPPAADEKAPTAEVLAAARIGEGEIEGPTTPPASDEVELAAEEVVATADVADAPDPSIMAIVAPPEPEPLIEPQPQSVMEPGPPAATPSVPPPPPPPAVADPATARPVVDPPMSMRSASWEGTVVYHAGQQTALVRPPGQPGMGVVASVISGPSGTRVGSVQINAEGLAVISLSEPARGPVSVAWFAVPAVDENLHQGRA